MRIVGSSSGESEPLDAITPFATDASVTASTAEGLESGPPTLNENELSDDSTSIVITLLTSAAMMPCPTKGARTPSNTS